VGSGGLGQTGSRLKRLENPGEFESSTAGSTAGNVRINVIFRRVGATIFFLSRKSNKYSITYSVCVIVCILSYPTCTAHAPYYTVMWPA